MSALGDDPADPLALISTPIALPASFFICEGRAELEKAFM